MSFSWALVSGIVSLCAGGVTGSLICVAAGRIFHKRYLKTHFVIVCILMSIAVAVAAGGFVFIDNLQSEITSVFAEGSFFLVMYLVGLLSVCFWKIVLPVAVLLYICLSTVTGINLYKKFGSQLSSVPVTISAGAVKAGENTFYADQTAGKSIVVEVYTIPGELLIPVPRVWYQISGLADSSVHVSPGESLRNTHGFSGLPSEIEPVQEVSDFLWQAQIQKFMDYVIGKPLNLLVPIPVDDVMPGLYTLNIKTRGEVLSCSLNRNL